MKNRVNLLVVARQDQFLSGAAENGNLSNGTLYTRDVIGGNIHWVIHTPKGWFISKDSFKAGRDNASHQQDVTGIPWLTWDPSNTEGMLS